MYKDLFDAPGIQKNTIQFKQGITIHCIAIPHKVAIVQDAKQSYNSVL